MWSEIGAVAHCLLPRARCKAGIPAGPRALRRSHFHDSAGAHKPIVVKQGPSAQPISQPASGSPPVTWVGGDCSAGSLFNASGEALAQRLAESENVRARTW